jgi:hypothetical protein
MYTAMQSGRDRPVTVALPVRHGHSVTLLIHATRLHGRRPLKPEKPATSMRIALQFANSRRHKGLVAATPSPHYF